MKKLRSISTIVFTILLTGCAGFITPTTQRIHFDSDIKSDIYINKNLVGHTPCDIDVERTKRKTYVNFINDKTDLKIELERKIEPHGIDFITGNSFYYSRTDYTINFKK